MKGKRIETEGSQMPEVLSLFKTFIKDQEIKSNLATIIPAFEIMKKNKIMLIISIFLVFLVTIGITTYLNVKDTSNKNVNMNQNVYEDIVDDKENIFNIEFQPFYGHEPNLEFLTNDANLIVSGTIDTSSLESVVENTFIYTNMDIHVIKVYKNSISHKYNNFFNQFLCKN